jgi:cytochrome P450
LEKEAATLILRIVKQRQAAGFEKDLLQMIVEGAKNSNLSQEATDRFIVDNCKNIYLAGYDTTAVSATWCLVLLASNQEWQERVRTEVLQVCQGRIPDADMLLKMKQVILFAGRSTHIVNKKYARIVKFVRQYKTCQYKCECICKSTMDLDLNK